MQIKRAHTVEEIKSCLPVLLQLRPHYTDQQQQMILQIQQQFTEGFELHYIEDQQQVLACAGIRFLTLLSHHSRVMYVDDLITDQVHRSQGYAKTLIDYLCDYAQSQGCTTITLDSGVQRFGAHRFYLREHFDIVSHHFVRKL
jgi:GNAT superfamily N-acetyltransferase